MERINKPRVFLSHSSKDKEFIRLLDNEFRKAKIDTWLDEYELRDGKPWLDMIFEDGLPACSAILVYLTEDSIESQMVKKELDSGLLKNLSENDIVFLPYVKNETLRSSLRIDLRTLHCRELNESNFESIFPSIVSEVWIGYLEQKIDEIRLRDRLKIQDLEKERNRLEKDLEGNPFSKNQIKDFKYIFKEISKIESFKFSNRVFFNEIPNIEKIYESNLLYLLSLFVEKGYTRFEDYRFKEFIAEYLNQNIHDNIYPQPYILLETDLTFSLKLFGLVSSSNGLFSNKVYKFLYWLGFTNQKINLNEIRELEG